MSTIASPRDSSIPSRQRLPMISTPSSSARPSIDSPRTESSPNRSSAGVGPPRRNRAALREYYNLKKEEQKGDDANTGTETPTDNGYGYSDVRESEMDTEDFDGEAFVRTALESQNLEELLGTYNHIRALEAEKKALVYDNYSKLIAATDTIRRMRANMDPLNPMASTLDPAIAQIYERANGVREELRSSMNGVRQDISNKSSDEKREILRREKARTAAKRVLEVPEQIRDLVARGNDDEAHRLWKVVRTVLERWEADGKGGKDVRDCIEDGEAALRGEPPNEKSWVNTRSQV